MTLSMYFSSFADLWAMEGHGPYVWSAYLIVLVTLVIAVYLPLARSRGTINMVQRRLRRDEPGERVENPFDGGSP